VVFRKNRRTPIGSKPEGRALQDHALDKRGAADTREEARQIKTMSIVDQ
jgi:hypothetical protein